MLLLYSFLSLVVFSQASAQVEYLCNSNAACGCSTSSALVTKIIGGETASVNTFGWAVSLAINQTWLCGGSILSSSWILTAAHCVNKMLPSEVLVSAATNKLFGFKQWRYATSVIVHPQYRRETIVNDIAVIKVSPPFNMTDPGIAKICLPAFTTEDYPPINSTVVAIGWGLLSEDGNVSETLQQVTLERIAYESDTCYPSITNELMQICAGVPDGGKGSCFGDSGSALMMFTPSRQWAVVGITSYGQECASAEYATVYTRVVYYLDWIRSVNVADAVTVGSDTTTTTDFYLLRNMTSSLTDNGSNSKNDSRSVYKLFTVSLIMLYFILIAL